MTSREAFLALTLIPRVGPVTIRRLLDAFGSPRDILSTPESRLRTVDGVGPALARSIAGWQDHADLTREKRRIRETGARFLTIEEEEYPALLREIPDPPPALYILGSLDPADKLGVALVGSRRATHYGLSCTRKLAFQLAHAGITIVSGLARGIDTAAHEGALEGGGRTLAVIGSGLGKIYPDENRDLATRIADGRGAVLSQFPIDQIPDKTTFPLRNRIVAGLSRALVVTECPAWSGAMITANLASEYNRSVYAVPGPIDRPSSAGCHKLIRDGAQLVTAASDILDEFQWLLPDTEKSRLANAKQEHEADTRPANLSAEENALLDALDTTEAHLDEIAGRTGLPVHIASATLLKLEMRRLVKQLPGSHFTRIL